MSAGVRGCPTCGSGNALNSARCWVCGAALTSAAPHEATPAILVDDGSTRALRIAGWSALLCGLGFTALLIAVQLALEWPGLLVPYALVVLVAFVALARTAWVQIRRRPAAATAHAGPPRGGVTGTDVAQGIALGLAIAIAVIAGLLLLALAALVIFFLICLALVGGMQWH